MIRDSSYYVDYQRYQIDAEQNNSILQKHFILVISNTRW